MEVSRRAVILGTATVAGTGLLVKSTGSTRAEADITMGELTIPDTSFRGSSVSAVDLSVTADYEFSANGSLDKFKISLLIGDSDTTLEPIDSVEKTDVGEQGSGTETLSGDVTSTYHFSLSSFEPATGTTQSRAVWVGLRFELYKDTEVVASTELIDTARIEVNTEELTTDVTLGGTGEITVS